MQRISSRQILEIRMLNDSKLKYFDDLPDIQLVQLLKNADNDAWAYVFVRVVRAVVCGSTKNGVSYRRILKDKYLEECDVWSDLYAEMIGRNKLELYWRKILKIQNLLEQVLKIFLIVFSSLGGFLLNDGRTILTKQKMKLKLQYRALRSLRQ